jgi:phospholipase/carboxylesterase
VSTGFGVPVVATFGSDEPTAPLVVLLHGRGSHERDVIGLAAHLPIGPAYVAVRAPIAEGGGFAWFANRGIGRPVAESLRGSLDWFESWVDAAAGAGRPVYLIGFSGGAAFAGGLILDRPARYAGAAILYGTMPFDAGLATAEGALTDLPVFVAQGRQDAVIPAELLSRTWAYLTGGSGASTMSMKLPGGHGMSTQAVEGLADWLAEQLA